MRYSLLTMAYLAAIYCLSAIPDLGTRPEDPLVLIVLNLGHAPLFAGLAFCVLKSIANAPDTSSVRWTLAFMASAVCAAVDEWHQSFVPGRQSSIGDLLVDLVGIGGMLLFLRLYALRNERPPVTAPACYVRHP